MKLMKMTAVIMALALVMSGCSFLRLPFGRPSSVDDTSSQSDTSSKISTSSAGSGQVTLGEFDGNTYYNDYFGISFAIPAGWSIATRAQIEQIFGSAAKMLSSMQIQTQQVLYLTVVSKHMLGTASNPNINLVAENISAAKGTVKTPADYMEVSKQVMEKTGYQYTFEDIETATHSGGEFALMHMTLNYQGTETYQTLICTIIKDYAVLFTFTYYTEDEMNEMIEISDTIELY